MPVSPSDLQTDSARAAWLRLVVRVGVPAAIAMYLVWTLTGSLSADVRATHALLMQHVSEQRALLEAICHNTAQTEAQHAICLSAALRRD